MLNRVITMFRMQRYAVEKRGKSDENEEIELNEVYELSTVVNSLKVIPCS